MQKAKLTITPTRVSMEGVPDSVLDLIDARTCYLHNEGTGHAPKYNVVDREKAWDGWIRFLHRPKTIPPWLPSGLRDVAMWTLHEAQVPFEVRDLRAPLEPYPEFAERYPKPIPLRDYQEAAVEALTASPDGVAEMPPRAGKTRTAFEMVRRLGLPTVWVAPSTSIVDQTVKAARAFFEDYDAVQVTSGNQTEVTNALLTVTTAAGCFTLKDPFWKSRHVLVCDEAHHYLAQKGWGSHLNDKCSHISHRKGLSGTFFRSSGDDMAMHAFLSRVLFRVDSKFLEERGHLVPCYSTFVRISGPKVRVPKKAGVRGFFGPAGHGTLGIVKHDFRNDAVASIAKHLSNSGRTVLVLVGAKKQGYAIAERLAPMFPSKAPNQTVSPVEFVSTDRPKHHIREVLDSFREHGNVRVLIGTSMVGEGTDLPPADALVYAAGGKAAVTLTQAWYRVLTQTGTKKYAVVVDFADCHHRKLKEHSQQRWHTMSTDPIFRMSYCDDLHQFHDWCQHLAPWGPER
jgi:superfamily II DNA or RNA helicase